MLLGGTGLVGSAVLRRLVAMEAVRLVVAPSRSPLRADAKVKNIVVEDLLSLTEIEATWQHLDAVICAIGTTRRKAGSDAAFRHADLEIPIGIAQKAVEADVPTFAYVSSMGADPRSPFLYTRTKGEAEAALRSLGFRSLTIVRPSLITGERLEVRPLERLAETTLRILRPLLPQSVRPNSAESIACELVEHILQPRAGQTTIRARDLGT